MIVGEQKQIETTIAQLYDDAKHDQIEIVKSLARSTFRPMQPIDFKDVFLSISKEQGEGLRRLIQDKEIKNIVEFGTSFGISTLFLAQGVTVTGGKIITTEIIESKAKSAIENFKKAGVNELIEVRIGNALETLKNHREPIDLLLLDGWKDLYLPIFQMLEPNFHVNTIIYVDNAEMAETQDFIETIGQNDNYEIQSMFRGKVVLLKMR